MIVLVPQLQTADQLSGVVIELREYLNKIHDRSARQRVANVHDEAMPPLSPLAQRLFEANNVTPGDEQAIKGLLTQLEEVRITAPRIRILLPAWPEMAIREKLAAHIRVHVHPLTMVGFAVRTDMGGGCILQAGSHRYDFSFRGQLLANKHKISELVNSYAKA